LKLSNSPSSKFPKKLKKVFLELGSEDRLEEILWRFYTKMSGDLLIGFFFTGKNLHSIIKQQKAFILRAMGIVKKYDGPSPKKAHINLPPILRGHFDRRMVLLKETLLEEGFSEGAIQAWIKFEEQFRKSIVDSEK